MRSRSNAALLALALLGACGGSDMPAPLAAPTATTIDPSQDKEGWAKSQGLELKKFDLNRDDRPDIFKFYRHVPDPRNLGNQLELLVRKEIDINHDGKIDVIQIWNDNGEKVEEQTDLDFDGRVDEIVYFAETLPIKRTIDLNYDGKPDVTKFYADGHLTRIESDRDGNNMVDTWEYFEKGELDRIGTDSDADGEVDKWERKREAAPEEQPAASSDASPPPGSAQSAPQ